VATRQVVDPAGVHWRVRRRWYPWRRALPLRDTWNGSLAAIVWVGWGALKVLAYPAAALLFVAASLVELVLELAIMPFVLLLRLVGATRWPVEIARQGKHFTTKYAPDLAEATTFQDDLVARLESGMPPEQPAALA
jgi:hypothetical protein